MMFFRWRYHMSYFWKVYITAASFIMIIVLLAKIGEFWISNLFVNSEILQNQIYWLADAYINQKEKEPAFDLRLRASGIAVYDMQSQAGALPPSTLSLAIAKVSLNKNFAVIQDQGWLSCAIMMPNKNIIAFGIATFSLPWATELLMWLIIIIAPTAIASLYFARGITRPLENLTEQAHILAGGDLTARITHSQSSYAVITQLERTFNRMANRLESILESERRLLGDISHELRSPLARLGVLTAILQKHYPEQHKEHFNRIDNEISAMNTLVGELLEQAQENHFKAMAGSFDLSILIHELAEESLLEFSGKSGGEGKTIDISISKTIPFAGNRVWMQKALGNIIRNALSFTPPNTAVDISSRYVEGHIEINVCDKGPGVPEQLLDEIFRPFFRGHGKLKHKEHIGLGLSIASRGITLHHGKLKAYNSHPGLLLKITLPISREQDFPEADNQNINKAEFL